jgi:glycosyltransferase involved in cell wall biosynthesis
MSEPQPPGRRELLKTTAVRVTASGGDSPLVPYPVDFSMEVNHRRGNGGDVAGSHPESNGREVAAKHPVAIGQYALACWNAYLVSNEERYRLAFIGAARWFVERELQVGPDAGGWPVPLTDSRWQSTTKCGLSASSQGIGVSVLVRAYRMTADPAFLEVAGRATTPFGRDILEGGVSAPIDEDGVFFEEDARYPANHALHGHLFALLGLIDYSSVGRDAAVGQLIERGIQALRTLIDTFDARHWSRYDLRHRGPALPRYQTLHSAQLRAIADYTGFAGWSRVAARWERCQSRWSARARQFGARQTRHFASVVLDRLRGALFLPALLGEPAISERVVVPVTGFPISGGIRAVLGGVAEAMRDEWRMEYFARDVGPHGADLLVHRFGSRLTSPWRFPTVWLYATAGAIGLMRLLRREYPYRLILAQDSVFTGAFAALVGRLAGARVVAVEHGTVTFPYSPVYKAERVKAVAGATWPRRLSARLQLSLYWPSLRALARIAVRFTDHFLVAGQESSDVYLQRLGVPPYKITRWRFMIDASRYTPPDPNARIGERSRLAIHADAILVSIVARLSPAKGLDVALVGLSRALSRLPAHLRRRVRVVIAGDGPLRSQLEADVARYGLEEQCVLWGETSSEEVVRLLGVTDVFLYTSTRGTNYSMAVLEAMAAGCAVIASTEPRSNEELLSEGRGMAIPAGDPEALSDALLRAIVDLPRCRQMGRLARVYISKVHTEEALRRSLLRATGWSGGLHDMKTPAGSLGRAGRTGASRPPSLDTDGL